MKNEEINSPDLNNCIIDHKKSILSRKIDKIVIILVLMLVAFGLVFVLSVTTTNQFNDPHYYFRKQAINIIYGIILMFVFAVLDYHTIQKFCILFYGISIFFLALVFIPNIGINNIFINLFFINIQPAPLSLAACIFLLAKYFSNNRFSDKPFNLISLCCLIVVFPLCLILMEPYISCAVILAFISLTIVFVKKQKYSYVMAGLFIILAIATIFIVNSNHLSSKINVWVDPFSSPDDGYQIIQSLYAIASGGVFGVGLGNGNAKNFLPDVGFGYIIAGITEEVGLIGAFIVVLLFALLLWRIIRIAIRSEDKLGFYLGLGIFTYFAAQIIFHILTVVNAIPRIDEFRLPFISGGSQLMIDLMLIGVILSISRYRRKRIY